MVFRMRFRSVRASLPLHRIGAVRICEHILWGHGTKSMTPFFSEFPIVHGQSDAFRLAVGFHTADSLNQRMHHVDIVPADYNMIALRASEAHHAFQIGVVYPMRFSSPSACIAFRCYHADFHDTADDARWHFPDDEPDDTCLH